MVSYTPGPWFVDAIAEGPVGDVSDAVGNSIAQAQARQPLAAGKRDDERLANARLISAAPDFLEASENLLFRIRNIGYWNKPDTEMYIKALEAAVSKAKGE